MKNKNTDFFLNIIVVGLIWLLIYETSYIFIRIYDNKHFQFVNNGKSFVTNDVPLSLFYAPLIFAEESLSGDIEKSWREEIEESECRGE